jgi:hypothetical protein
MKSENLYFFPDACLVICADHNVAMKPQPQRVANHIAKGHNFTMNLNSKLATDIRHLSVKHNKSDAQREIVFNSLLTRGPIPLLPVKDGFKCLVPGCNRIRTTYKSMRTHSWESHRGTGLNCKSIHCQTIYSGNYILFFECAAQIPAETVPDNLQAFVDALNPNQTNSEASETLQEDDRLLSPFLQESRWMDFVEYYDLNDVLKMLDGKNTENALKFNRIYQDLSIYFARFEKLIGQANEVTLRTLMKGRYLYLFYRL